MKKQLKTQQFVQVRNMSNYNSRANVSNSDQPIVSGKQTVLNTKISSNKQEALNENVYTFKREFIKIIAMTDNI